VTEITEAECDQRGSKSEIDGVSGRRPMVEMFTSFIISERPPVVDYRGVPGEFHSRESRSEDFP
jgi:hypothetical protein